MNKKDEVYKKLEKVLDPELDEPLTDLNFIDTVHINDNNVEVVFRLPTYWCSPNFAYIMAEDIKKYVSELDWARHVSVRLLDHSVSEQINKGVTEGKQFSETFDDWSSPGGNLEELRRTFQIKGFYARQDRLIRLLRKMGYSKEELISMTMDELKALRLSEEGSVLRDKYLEKKAELNHPETSTKAITDPEGNEISAEDISDYLLGIKSTRVSMEFNAAYCKGLLATRYNLETQC